MHGGWLGVASLLRKNNFCEPKRAKHFRNITPFFWCGLILLKKLYHNRRDVHRPSNNDQLFRFRTLTSYCAMLCHAMLCYAMLCFAIFIPTSSIGHAPIAMLPKHSLSSLSGRRISNSVTTIWFLSLIIYSF